MARGKKKESALTPEEKLAQALVPDWEQPYRVPKNWQWVVLKSCCMDFFSGKSPKYSKEPTNVKIIGQQANRREGIDLSYVKFGTSDFAEAQEERMWLQKNDVLLNTLGSGTIGRSGIYKDNERLLTDGHLFVFRSNECYLPDLMYYYLCANEEQVINSANGSTNQKFLSLSTFSLFPLPVPPIAEQQRIVDRIEYLFAKLDEAKEKAQSVLDSFETRKAAILHKAFTGELTAKWRAEHGISVETWKRSPLTEIATVISGYAFSSKDFREENTVPCIKITNVGVGEYIADDYEYLPDSYLEEYRRFAVHKGDILISLTRSFINAGLKVCICEEDRTALLNQRVALIKDCNTGYIFYYLRSDEVLRYVKEKSKTTNQPNLSIKDLNNMLVAMPQWDEQKEIVRILDSLFAKEQQAKEAAEAVMEKIDLLKKSILARAFRGELGTNDPTEESALELLKQILEEEAPTVPKKRSKSIPKELKQELHSDLEQKIVKLYFQKESTVLPVAEIMSVSSQTFEVFEALRGLEQRNVLKKQNSGHYKLMR